MLDKLGLSQWSFNHFYGRLVKIVDRTDDLEFDIIASDKIAPRREFMIGDIEFVEEQDVPIPQKGGEHRQRKQCGRIEVGIQVEHAGGFGGVDAITILV